jgi:4-diphosphocytidyl-2-C-methyl-D-erythritol kinase
MAPLSLAAPAKLNLSLAVVGRRADGHHELSSTFVLLELADQLRLTPGASELQVECADPAVPIDASNLAWRGLLAGLDGVADPASLALQKRIPATAGLGGGSADAAAAWRLARRWIGAAESPTDEQLRALSRVGADVPFFAAQLPAAHVTGIGERLEQVDLPREREVVLVLAPFGLSTTAVFAELRPGDWSGEPEPGHNDLLAAARRLRPALDDIMAGVRAAGGDPHLTGSGPTLYTLSDDPEQADALAHAIERRGMRALRTRLARRAATIEPMREEETPIR